MCCVCTCLCIYTGSNVNSNALTTNTYISLCKPSDGKGRSIVCKKKPVGITVAVTFQQTTRRSSATDIPRSYPQRRFERSTVCGVESELYSARCLALCHLGSSTRIRQVRYKLLSCVLEPNLRSFVAYTG